MGFFTLPEPEQYIRNARFGWGEELELTAKCVGIIWRIREQLPLDNYRDTMEAIGTYVKYLEIAEGSINNLITGNVDVLREVTNIVKVRSYLGGFKQTAVPYLFEVTEGDNIRSTLSFASDINKFNGNNFFDMEKLNTYNNQIQFNNTFRNSGRLQVITNEVENYYLNTNMAMSNAEHFFAAAEHTMLFEKGVSNFLNFVWDHHFIASEGNKDQFWGIDRLGSLWASCINFL